VEHGWRRKAEARKALTARLRVLARIAYDESRRVPDADAHFPLPPHPSTHCFCRRANLFVLECPKAKDMFLRYGISVTFVAELKTLVGAFEDCTHGGWHRRTTIFVTREGTATELARGLDAVRTLDVIVRNALAHQPTLMALWREIRRNDSRRKAPATSTASVSDDHESRMQFYKWFRPGRF